MEIPLLLLIIIIIKSVVATVNFNPCKHILQKHKDLFVLWTYTNKSKPFAIPIIFMTKRSSCFHC